MSSPFGVDSANRCLGLRHPLAKAVPARHAIVRGGVRLRDNPKWRASDALLRLWIQLNPLGRHCVCGAPEGTLPARAVSEGPRSRSRPAAAVGLGSRRPGKFIGRPGTVSDAKLARSPLKSRLA
jgi:hypothetical protein